jgi:tRNA modification GTPase
MREVFFDEDTIFAPITPNVHSAVTYIRVSGDKAIDIVDKIFVGKRELKSVRSHSIVYGRIVDNDEVVDDVLVSVMRAPNSYTGEDVVEIGCHGNPIIVGRVMELLKMHGARMARPGEFTRRAVLNGKMDLVQAEAVNSLIMSNNLSSLKVSRKLLDGKLSERVVRLKEKLLDLLAYLEVLVDHPEEDLAHRDWNYIEETIKSCVTEVEDIIEKSKKSSFFTEGIKLCIAGKTNVGKSSLMNAILGEDRAIVSNIPGTTRDVVKEIMSINGVPVSVFDTAGIRESKNVIETEGIRRTIESVKSADVILLVFDVSSKITKNDILVVESIKKYADNKDIFLILNKIDIASEEAINKKEKEIQKLLDEYKLRYLREFKISAREKVNIGELKNSIVETVVGNVNEEIENILLVNSRHKELMSDVLSSLREALESAQDRMSEEFIAIGIRDALAYIGEMIGEITTEDLMDRIFASFCVGK